jgi:hypothetical protein
MLRRVAMALALIVVTAIAPVAYAVDSGSANDLQEIKREIQRIKAYEREEQERAKAERTREQKRIRELESKVDALESQNRQLRASNTRVESESADTTRAIKELQQQSEAGPTTAQLSRTLQQYMGSHTFQVSGAAGVDFIYDKQSSALNGMAHQSANTFNMNWEPLILYRPLDWILFEAEFEGAFAPDGSTGVAVPLMDFHVFLNDYAEIVAGLFDQPFGDWYESQSPMWVNRFITAPLPFGAEPVVAPSEMGVQLRGGLEWGQLGQDFDYTVWTGNGPGYSAPVLGAALNGVTGVATSGTNGKAIGARLRFYPLPIDANLGRLELGASTLNGKWLDGHWFNSWGVDFSYFKDNVQTRGEWLTSYRQMPGGFADNRQGWYLQLGYFLHGFHPSFLPDQVNRQIEKLEPLIRYSGVNQHAVLQEDVGAFPGLPQVVGANIPDFEFNGSPALFAPHSREVALGLDYWIAPSIVWQNELDIELPRAGGFLTSATGGASVPVGSTPNDTAFLSQFTIGF